jgi:dTDP-4-amino-4,6-dideoxygalactose transaminase
MAKLALTGGSKTVLRPGPHFTWPPITKTIERAVLAQLHQSISIYNRSGIIEKFEERFKSYHHKKYGLLTSSGTEAIHTMFVAAGISRGDEVICPAYTFYATVTPLFHVGAIPVLVDADETGNIDPALIEGKITKKTRAVIVTHMWGIPCKMEEIRRICRKHKLLLLEDCSHAHGAKYKNKLVGTWGDAAAWSLQGQKIITGGEGGILLTDNKEIYYRSLLFGHYNKRCFQEIPKNHPLAAYSMTGMGLKLRSHPLAVTIASELFKHLGEILKYKSKYADFWSRELRGVRGIRAPKIPVGAKPSWYAYVLQYKSEELGGLPIEKFYEALRAEGCAEADMPNSTCPLNLLQLFQAPGKLFPEYRNKVKYKPGDFPVAENFYHSAIKLPVWTAQEDFPFVKGYVKAIIKVCEHYKELQKEKN